MYYVNVDIDIYITYTYITKTFTPTNLLTRSYLK